MMANPIVIIKYLEEGVDWKKGEIVEVSKDHAEIMIHKGKAKEVTKEALKAYQWEQLAKKLTTQLKSVKEKIIRLDSYQANVCDFYNYQPFFYDNVGIFWFWNGMENRYDIVDEVDVMDKLDKILGMHGQTVSRGIKLNYLEAFKRIGRRNIPQEAPTKWIQFKNKAISLKSGKIYDVKPNYFFTNPIPHAIGSSDQTPTMDNLFKDWVGDNYHLLYEMIAYCCLREYPIQLLFCLFGSGRNGKTSFLKILSNFFGVQNICSSELDLLMNNRFESFKLYKKLICLMGETNLGILNKSSILKRLVGGDMIGFEMKNKQPFDAFNYAKLIIASNSLPTSEDTSEGFYRRWMIIDFPNQFPEGKDIILTIPDEEYENLANKISKILPKLLEKGHFQGQGDTKQREERYIMASNPFPLFLKEFCKLEDGEFISFSELYTAFVTYLNIKKRRRVSKKEFRVSIENEGLVIDKTSKKMGEEWKTALWIQGITLDFHSFHNFHNHISIQPISNRAIWKYRNERNERNENQIPIDYEPIHQKCDKCGLSPCYTFDQKGKPVCEFCHKSSTGNEATKKVPQEMKVEEVKENE